MLGPPIVSESETMLRVSVPLSGGGKLEIEFREREIKITLLDTPSPLRLRLQFEWVEDRSALQEVLQDRLHYRFQNFDYSLHVVDGSASRTSKGVDIAADERGSLRLLMAQSR